MSSNGKVWVTTCMGLDEACPDVEVLHTCRTKETAIAFARAHHTEQFDNPDDLDGEDELQLVAASPECYHLVDRADYIAYQIKCLDLSTD